MRKIAIVIVLATFLISCATPYQKNSNNILSVLGVAPSGGYKETRLQKNVFKINFKGNGYISEEKAADYAMLRAAEVTLENQFRYFIVLDENTKSLAYQDSSSYTHTNINGQFDSNGNFSGSANTWGGGSSTYYKPRSTLLIAAFSEMPKNSRAVVFNAEEVRNNIRSQYRIKTHSKK